MAEANPRHRMPPKWAKVARDLFPKGLYDLPGKAAATADIANNVTRIGQLKHLIDTRQVIPGTEQYDRVGKEKCLLEMRNDWLKKNS